MSEHISVKFSDFFIITIDSVFLFMGAVPLLDSRNPSQSTKKVQILHLTAALLVFSTFGTVLTSRQWPSSDPLDATNLRNYATPANSSTWNPLPAKNCLTYQPKP